MPAQQNPPRENATVVTPTNVRPGVSALAIDLNGALYEVQLPSGDTSLIGHSGLDLADIAWDSATSTLFAVDETTLYTLDPKTAEPLTQVAIAPQSALPTGLVADGGTLYVSFGAELVGTLDPQTGAVHDTTSLGGPPYLTGLESDGDLAFVGSRFYATALVDTGGEDSFPDNATYRIDLATHTVAQEEVLGTAKVGFCVDGLVPAEMLGQPVLFGLTCDGSILEIDQSLNYGSTLVGKSNVKFRGATAR